MRKTLILLLSVSLVLSLALFAGCGGDGGKRTIETEGDKKITVEEPGEEGEGSKYKVEGEQGEATIEVGELEPSEENLGAPIYPGAELVPGSSLSSKTTSGEKVFVTTQAEFTTGDDRQKATDWYQERLGQPMESTPEETYWIFRNEAGQVVEVKVEVCEGKTKITIAQVGGDVDIRI